MDVVAAEAAGAFVRAGIRVWRHVPHRGHRRVVDAPQFVQRDEGAVAPLVGFERLPIHPPRRVGVPLDLGVLAQRLGADGPALLEQLFHLAQHKGVAFQRGGVVRLLMPDIGPDRLGLLRGGQAAEPATQLLNRPVQACVHRRSAWTPSCHDLTVLPGSLPTVA